MTFDRDNEMDFENRVIAPEYVPEDAEVENPLRRVPLRTMWARKR